MRVPEGKALLRGVGIVIDDRVFGDVENDERRIIRSALKQKRADGSFLDASKPKRVDDIVKIVRALERKGIPLIKCNKVPDDACGYIRNLGSVAFALIDWGRIQVLGEVENFKKPSVTLGSSLETFSQNDVMDFIKEFLELCVAPIFVLSTEAPDTIRRRLAGVLGEDVAAKIIVERKAKIVSKVVSTIEKWLRRSPSKYVLKMWDNVYQDAHYKMFKEFSGISPYWPVPLYNAYKKDGDDPSCALTELLFRNLRGRMGNLSLVKSRFRTGVRKPGREVLRKIIETSVVVPDEYLKEGQFGCGDLFHKREKKNGKWKERYRLLISCDCDCIDHSSQDATTGGGANVVLLSASIVTNSALKKRTVFNPAYGFDQPKDRAYLFPVDGGKGLCFLFSNMAMDSICSLVNSGYKRIGRVCAPYITDIRQRNAQWLQREGFPKMPIQAVR